MKLKERRMIHKARKHELRELRKNKNIPFMYRYTDLPLSAVALVFVALLALVVEIILLLSLI